MAGPLEVSVLEVRGRHRDVPLGRGRISGDRALGHDERFIRLWRFYLAYCEAAFAARQTDVIQFTLRAR